MAVSARASRMWGSRPVFVDIPLTRKSKPNVRRKMITVKALTRKYARTTAVNQISFSVDKGQIVGFLGPNGAGKTTTMRMLTCFLPPSSGTATVAGFDILDQSMEVRKRIGTLRKRGAEPRDVELCRNEISPEMVLFGRGHCRVEFDEALAGFNALSVVNVNGPHDAGIQRLDQLGPAAGNDLAIGRGDDVDLAEGGPCDRDAEDRNDRCADGASEGRGRRLGDLQRRWQECEFVVVPADRPFGEGNDDLVS